MTSSYDAVFGLFGMKGAGLRELALAPAVTPLLNSNPGAKGLALAFEAAKAVAKGVTPKVGKDKNAKVEL